MNNSCFESGAGFGRRATPFACMLIASVLLTSAGAAFSAETASTTDVSAKMDPGIVAALRGKSSKPLRVLIEPQSAAPKVLLEPMNHLPREQRLRRSYDTLAAAARQSQAPIVRWLRQQGVAFRAFTVVNAISAELTSTQLRALAARADVRYLADDPVVRNKLPGSDGSRDAAPKDACNNLPGVPWGIERVNADDVWALGARGQGIVVAGQDTGYDFDHPSLIAQYRGNGAPPDHNYNWHDAIHAFINGGNACGLNVVSPCDDSNHGTHTMGTMVGENDATGFTVGVAPDAQWIGCRNMEEGDGTPSTYLECFDWFLAPTDLSGSNPDPSKAPHVINNSWGCPTSEGCTSANWSQMNTAVNNLTAAGVLVVASAGNAMGATCSSIAAPAAMYANSLTVAWTSNTPGNSLHTSSMRGPVTADGSNRMKPDISAPGSGVCSTVPGTGFGTLSGTSMAGPHVAGVAALLMSAFPTLKNDPPAVRDVMLQSALPLPQAGSCGGFAGSDRPNPFTGWGLVDALAAYQRVQAAMYLFGDGFE